MPRSERIKGESYKRFRLQAGREGSPVVGKECDKLPTVAAKTHTPRNKFWSESVVGRAMALNVRQVSEQGVAIRLPSINLVKLVFLELVY
jgi:hypothetical protein